MVKIGPTRPRFPADIQMTAVTKTYPGSPVAALADFAISIEAGQFVCLVGASGCGKSTVLRMLAGFEKASSGAIAVGSEPVEAPGPERGVVFQDYGLFPWLTVEENVSYGPRQAGYQRTEVVARSARYLSMVGLEGVARSFPHQLSGGMQQRVAIARVLINEPEVLLMDEPFGALDALTRSSMQQELKRIHSETGTTVVFVTHSIDEAVYLADRVVVMTGGASTGRPGWVRSIVDIDLLEPRDTTSVAFNDYVRQISRMVHGESS